MMGLPGSAAAISKMTIHGVVTPIFSFIALAELTVLPDPAMLHLPEGGSGSFAPFGFRMFLPGRCGRYN